MYYVLALCKDIRSPLILFIVLKSPMKYTVVPWAAIRPKLKTVALDYSVVWVGTFPVRICTKTFSEW